MMFHHWTTTFVQFLTTVWRTTVESTESRFGRSLHVRPAGWYDLFLAYYLATTDVVSSSYRPLYNTEGQKRNGQVRINHPSARSQHVPPHIYLQGTFYRRILPKELHSSQVVRQATLNVWWMDVASVPGCFLSSFIEPLKCVCPAKVESNSWAKQTIIVIMWGTFAHATELTRGAWMGIKQNRFGSI